MAVPTFVTVGAYTQTSAGTSNTPALPASRVNNNVLIALIRNSTTGKTFSVGGGWTIGDQINSGMSGAWAWRLVDGTEAAPVFTWTGNSNATGQVFQYTGNATPTPVGASKKATATSTTITTASLTTTSNNSTIFNAGFVNSSTNPGAPTNYTLRSSSNVAIGSAAFSDAVAYVSGSATDACSITVSSVAWLTFGIEILGTGTTSNEPAVRATQVVKQVLESYSDPTNVLVSQVVMQVLRSASSITPSPARSRAQILG